MATTSKTWRDGDTLRFLSVWVNWNDSDGRGNENLNNARSGSTSDTQDDTEGLSADEDRRAAIILPLLPGLFTSLAANVQGVDITPLGEVLATTTDRAIVDCNKPYFPSVTEYGLGSRLPVLPRSKFTVLKRIALGVDQVSYVDPVSGQETVAVLKLAFRNPTYVGGGIWTDIHVLRRLPPHPNVVAIKALVVEEVSGLGVVGYAMPYLDGYSLAHQPKPRSFKLKWLREVIDAVDFLNLKSGILYSDLVEVNIFVNTAT
ncbi:hypothetical protein B0T14DRAFT_568686 [Immersiella caudata]|uniref:Protein kinase domain-containing protein n=1 Tax=Immersiella caudata TaxID=314043 RepID=A0AA40BXF7_9PEZI|nr:hypothetical protein B0T14DRAFT_568686 [Immersiella caudata]